MSTDDLDRLPSEALHSLAVDHARRHLDAKFFWELLKVMPAAQALAGDLDESQVDTQSLIARLDDVGDAGKGETAEALRPFYLDYLRRNEVSADR